MKTRTTYILSTLLILCISVLCAHRAFGVNYKDAPALEPYALTEKLIHELTQAGSDVKTYRNSFRLKGIAIIAADQKKDSITLSVDTDSRLNLWRGRPNDLASSHLGRMRLAVTSVIDENGNNIYNKSRDKPWTEKMVIYNLGDGKFRGSRLAYFQKNSNESHIKQISGTIYLSLPVNITRFTVKADSPESAKTLLGRDEISSVQLRNGIYIEHPKSIPDFKATIMGFNSQGERINITSEGSAGGKSENHWYYFSNETAFDKMFIFIPGAFIDREVSFTIDIRNE